MSCNLKIYIYIFFFREADREKKNTRKAFSVLPWVFALNAELGFLLPFQRPRDKHDLFHSHATQIN